MPLLALMVFTAGLASVEAAGVVVTEAGIAVAALTGLATFAVFTWLLGLKFLATVLSCMTCRWETLMVLTLLSVAGAGNSVQVEATGVAAVAVDLTGFDTLAVFTWLGCLPVLAKAT